MKRLETIKDSIGYMRRISVFKTDVADRPTADAIIEAIRERLPGSTPSFDLDDCDRVLRVESRNSGISKPEIERILHTYGHELEVLP